MASALGLMTILTFVQVVLRYVFQSGIVWSLEATSYIFGLLIVITMAVSSLASLTLLPLLLNGLKPRFLYKKKRGHEPEEIENETMVSNS